MTTKSSSHYQGKLTDHELDQSIIFDQEKLYNLKKRFEQLTEVLEHRVPYRQNFPQPKAVSSLSQDY